MTQANILPGIFGGGLFVFVANHGSGFATGIVSDANGVRPGTVVSNNTNTLVSIANQAGGFTLIGDYGFPGGDSTCGQTGWREGSVNLSAFAGTGAAISVDLIYSANDAGDNIYDTHVLLDNMRFSTVFIDANIISGATADRPRVEQEIRNANEVLSQAGLNLQLRDVQTVADPAGLLDLDATFTGTLTAEENSRVGLSRSGVATDMNYYYVRSLTGIAALAIALGPDDFSDINILTNSGILMTDTVTPETLANELGHILISPDTAGSVLEHNVGVASNIMNTTSLSIECFRTPLPPALSQGINRQRTCAAQNQRHQASDI